MESKHRQRGSAKVTLQMRGSSVVQWLGHRTGSLHDVSTLSSDLLGVAPALHPSKLVVWGRCRASTGWLAQKGGGSGLQPLGTAAIKPDSRRRVTGGAASAGARGAVPAACTKASIGAGAGRAAPSGASPGHTPSPPPFQRRSVTHSLPLIFQMERDRLYWQVPSGCPRKQSTAAFQKGQAECKLPYLCPASLRLRSTCPFWKAACPCLCTAGDRRERARQAAGEPALGGEPPSSIAQG